ncbi:hypothetical protein BATR1942_07885 [Bacillus atrophaeus 1942]|uniref:Transposase n=1 Tax=Bacillus atrophaeus (strain 1942) TaxID=720555 RepID=A0ABN3Z903_BACA1|nr:hypothetical protein BATR1942_07885 [Bacillus atrophaeus 1942]EIM11688.1 hypothetical protein UY9_05477 [Bacillus atrophaeus C89]KFK83234.1 hypothetical protein DK44_2162 [Bacillus atrophaeus]
MNSQKFIEELSNHWASFSKDMKVQVCKMISG